MVGGPLIQRILYGSRQARGESRYEPAADSSPTFFLVQQNRRSALTTIDRSRDRHAERFFWQRHLEQV